MLNSEAFALLTKLFACLFEKSVQQNNELDPCFSMIVDKPLDPDLLIQSICDRHSLKPHILDSLKRGHRLFDLINILSSLVDAQIDSNWSVEKKKRMAAFLKIVDDISKYTLLICTIESLSSESQRFVGNLIRKNDLPIPFAYYAPSEIGIVFKINFNILAETLCFTNEKVLLLLGSPTAVDLGKTHLQLYLFADKREELLSIERRTSLRFGCVDIVFGKNGVQSYIIFDVHGTMTTYNEDLITAIQHYCSLQILCVTETDLQDESFLLSTLNYSSQTHSKPTIVVIFDPNYEDQQNQSAELSSTFQQRFKQEQWPHLHCMTAPIFKNPSPTSDQRAIKRGKRLRQSFEKIFSALHHTINQTNCCESIFSIQSYYLDVKALSNASPAPSHYFQVLHELRRLFDEDKLSDQNNNLRIVTPVSYFDACIQQREQELTNNYEPSNESIRTELEQLRKERQKIDRIPKYTTFFIEVMTKRQFIEMLIIEKYLEHWRVRYQPALLDRLGKVREMTMKSITVIKQLEFEIQNVSKEKNDVENQNVFNELRERKLQMKIQQQTMKTIEDQLANIDLTVGIFCDEILALYDHVPRLFEKDDLLNSLAKRLVIFMFKGYAFHVLRGRPLRCQSKLIQECLKFIQQSTEKAPFVLTVIGAQSSAKSSLLNATFGCNFRVSAGRCTIGMYLSVVQWKSHPILILDTEGLMSLEESGSIFDNQMVSMAILSSHLVLINHKGDISSDLEHLIGMSFYAKLQIQSHVKPKLLFILRDKRDNTSERSIFVAQLSKLKQNLHKESEFLRSSIDKELEICDQNVILLPSALDLGTSLRFGEEDQTFPRKVLDLRRMVIKTIETLVQRPQRDNAYIDLADLYQKISSHWEAIDKLGPNLLAYKRLQELALLSEVRKISEDIIGAYVSKVNATGRTIMNSILEQISDDGTIQEDKHFTTQFVTAIDAAHQTLSQQAHLEFASMTERSCYLPKVTQKVQKTIEPPLRFAQILLKLDFEQRLHKMNRDVRVAHAQRRLLTATQKEFDDNVNLTPAELEKRVEEIYNKEKKTCIESLTSCFKAPKQIRMVILTFYNTTVSQKTATPSNTDVYNWLSHLSEPEFFEHCERLKGIEVYVISGTFTPAKKIRNLFRNSDEDHAWSQLKDKVHWFHHPLNSSQNKKLLCLICNDLLPQLQKEIIELVNKSSELISDQRVIMYMIQLINNVLQSDVLRQRMAKLVRHKLAFDLAIIALKTLIDAVTDFENRRQQNELNEASDELNKWKRSIQEQVLNMHDSQAQGMAMASSIAKKIFKEIERILLNKVLNDIKEDIVKSQFINHEQVQKQAYEESISQANGENILKYVFDINRYFLELSLRQIKTSLGAINHQHTCSLEQLIYKVFTRANDVVQSTNYTKSQHVVKEIENAIRQIQELRTDVITGFKLAEVISLPIQALKNFKGGFQCQLAEEKKYIHKKTVDSVKGIEWKAFRECNVAISKRLGCPARCPGCGTKCCRPEPHDSELVVQWAENCKCTRSAGECKCVTGNPVMRNVHESSHHIMGAFHGRKYYKTNTPVFYKCYQNWTTHAIIVGEEEIFPQKKYYNQTHPEWYNNLNSHSEGALDRSDEIAPPDQRRAWMVVRDVLIRTVTVPVRKN